jgi:hypothetical protein
VAPCGQGGSGAGVASPVGGARGGDDASFVGAGASGASLVGDEVASAKDPCTVSEGEAVAFFFFFGVGGTGGSARSASHVPALMLLAPVSSISGGEVKSSSARGLEGSGAARPQTYIASPPRGEAGDLPAPEGTGLA